VSLLVTDAELAHIQSTYPYLDIKPLNSQQEKFIMLLLRGIPLAAAERGVGYSLGRGRKTLELENVKKILEYFREHEFNDVRVTRESLTQLLFEAHSKAANATEEVMAVREIGKMHDLYESDRHKGTTIQHNTQINNITSQRQVERLTDEQLMQLAGMQSLEPKLVPRGTIVVPSTSFTEE
jgi:hypothetical protein